MKKLFLIAFCAAALCACQNNQKTTEASANTAVANQEANAQHSAISDPDAPKVEVEKAVYEFGVIKQGEKVSYTFKFKNAGKTLPIFLILLFFFRSFKILSKIPFIKVLLFGVL